jgi:hypothetical protein
MKKGFALGLALGLLGILSVPAVAQAILTYRDRTGRVDIIIHMWKEELPFGAMFHSRLSDGEIHRVEIDGSNETISYRFASPSRNTSYLARREGNTILIEGTLHGSPLSRRLPIDATPWMESMEWSLQEYAMSGSPLPLTFWVLQPFEVRAYLLQATGELEENIVVNGQAQAVKRVRVRPAGILAPFWSALYWFRASDGRFVRYEGVRGLPGTPKTVVELIDTGPDSP